MKLTEEFSCMGIYSEHEIIKKFLEFENNVLLVKGKYIYANGLLNEIKNVKYKYQSGKPYTVLVLDFFPKKERY